MVQIWRPLGRVVAPVSDGSWWYSHASYPTPLVRDDGRLSIFFSVRDASNRSCLASVDLALDGAGFSVLSAVRGPLFTPGARGAFDGDGVAVTSLVADGDRLLAYYLGWMVGASVPFSNFIGLAVGDAEGTRFERTSVIPVIGRTTVTPLTLGYPWVLRQGERWRMWFGSHLCWGAQGLDMVHVIQQATSPDGRVWLPQEGTVIPLAGKDDPAEFAVSRPAVLREADGTFSMWYARRRPGYELGFAVSADGEQWRRRDDSVRFVGVAGDWEDAERTYPAVFDYRGRRYMLYNGNSYGRTGFGIALLEY